MHPGSLEAQLLLCTHQTKSIPTKQSRPLAPERMTSEGKEAKGRGDEKILGFWRSLKFAPAGKKVWVALVVECRTGHASIYQARQLMGNLCKIVSQTRQMSNIEPFDALTTFLVIANSSTIFRRGQLMQFVHPTTIFSQWATSSMCQFEPWRPSVRAQPDSPPSQTQFSILCNCNICARKLNKKNLLKNNFKANF